MEAAAGVGAVQDRARAEADVAGKLYKRAVQQVACTIQHMPYVAAAARGRDAGAGPGPHRTSPSVAAAPSGPAAAGASSGHTRAGQPTEGGASEWVGARVCMSEGEKERRRDRDGWMDGWIEIEIEI